MIGMQNFARMLSFSIMKGEINMVEDVAKNSEISQYQDTANVLCINVLNGQGTKKQGSKKDWLPGDKDRLLKKYPKFEMEDKSPRDFFMEIIQKLFTDGFKKDTFFRSYVLGDKIGQNPPLAIRYKRTLGDYLSDKLPDNKTLMFKGFASGNYFVVTSVSEQYNEDQLCFEAPCQITRYDDKSRVKRRGGFLYKLAKEAESLNKYTKERLQEWKDYIKWRRTIVIENQHRYAARYVKVENKDGYLAFTLQFPDKESYDVMAKKLKAKEGLAAYDYKQCSDDNGDFLYDEKSKVRFNQLGKCKRDLCSKEGREINGRYEIELVYAFPKNQDDLKGMERGELDAYVQEHYPETGFLAPVIIQDVALYNRLDRAVTALQDDNNSRSPNLAMWVFDVKQARLPQNTDREEWERRVGDKWLNEGIAGNPNQREAIYKMLEAPDLCLVQGPPGTGKTTVIAEAIYQLARQGNRVLLASQSHDAVDNALDRLAHCSEIRAVRFNERNDQDDEEYSRFSEKKVLSTYYHTLDQSVRDRFLSPWEENRQNYRSCEKDLYDWQNVFVDIKRLNENLTKKNEEVQVCKGELVRVKENLLEAEKENDKQENARRQYQNFCGAVERSELSDGGFYIPDDMASIVASIFIRLIDEAAQKGVKLLSPAKEEILRREPVLCLRRIDRSCKLLSDVLGKLAEAAQNADTDAGINELRRQEIEDKIKEIKRRMDEEDDGEERKRLSDERKKLRKEKEELGGSGGFRLSDDEETLFDEEGRKKIENPNEQAQVAQELSRIKVAYAAALKECLKRMKEAIDSYESPETDSLVEQQKSLAGKLKNLNEECKEKQAEIADKKKLNEKLTDKYKCEESDVESCIEAEMNRLDEEWNHNAEIRKVWMSTLKKFAEKLEDDDTAKYDKDRYNDIYISSCNVVGITCTADMRNLDEKFSDFDVVVIDEVSKATPPELLPVLMRARKTILVGDHRQLPPVFNEYAKNYNELVEAVSGEADETEEDTDTKAVLREEDLEKYRNMVTSSLFREYFEQADERIKHSLLTQYRMHSDIQRVINRFYNGKLESGIEAEENKTKAHELNVKTDRGESFLRSDSHAYWVDSSELKGRLMEQSRYPGSTSLYNIFERYIIVSILSKINDAYAKMGQSGITVGVISFYGSQVGDLKKAVKEMRNRGKLKALDVDVNTVDRFQGKEKQIIITSLVCNTRKGNASQHVASFERINVAFSRAQNLLIIVGAKDLYKGLSVSIPDMDTGEIKSARIYQNIIDDIAQNGALIAGETLIAENDVANIRAEYRESHKEAKEG